MKKEQTIVEKTFERYRNAIYKEFLKYVKNKDDIKVIKCMETTLCGKTTIKDIETADSVRIIKAPKSGYIKIKATFNEPKKASNMCIIYYKDKVLTQHRFNVENSASKSLVIEEMIAWRSQ